MASKKQAQIVITANTAVAERLIDQMRKHTEQLQQRMEALDLTTAEGKKEFERLNQELVSYNTVVAQNISNTERVRNAMNNLSGTSLRDLRRALAAAKKEMQNLSSDDAMLSVWQGRVEKLQAQIDVCNGKIKEQGQSWKDTAKELLSYAAAFSVLDELKNKMAEAVQQNLSFGDALSDVRKVSGLSAAEVNELANRLSQLDTRTTVEDLQRLAYEGGKLGVGNMGMEALRGFVEASNQIKVALGDDLGDDALTSLSKITGVMGDMQNLGVEKSLLAVGSSINELAQSSVASGGAIVDFTQRMSGIGKYAKMPTADLMALGAACDAAGLSMETSGTAFSIMVSNLQKQPKEIEKSLGVMDGSISKLVEQGQMMSAVQLTLEKMGEKNSMGQLTDTFKALGGEGARMMSVLATMSKNTNMLTDALDTSRTAFREATSVTGEYNTQQISANAILERANNLWMKAFVNPEGVDNVKVLTQAWYDLSKSITESPIFTASISASFQMLGMAVKGLIALLPMLITMIGGMGLAKAITYVIPLLSAARLGIQRVSAAATGNVVAAGRMAIAWRGLSMAMKTNVFILAASVIVELAFAVAKFVNSTKDADKALYDFKKDINKAGVESAAAEKRVGRFAQAIKDAGKNEKERMAAIKTFNKEYGQYMSQLLSEKSTVEDLAKAYAEVVKNMRARAFAEAKEKGQKVVDQKYVGARNWSNRFESQTQGTGLEAWTRDRLEAYFQDAKKRNMNAEQMITDLGQKFGVREDPTKDIINTWARRDQLGKIKYGKTAFTRKANKQEESLWLASRYIISELGAENAQKKLDKAYSGLDTKGTITTDTEEETATTTDTSTNTDPNRAVNDARANIAEFITKIRNFYERQVTAEIERMTAANIEKPVQDRVVSDLRMRMEDALSAARDAIVLGNDTWKKFRATMENDRKEMDDEYGQSQSRMLLDSIMSEDTSQLRANILKHRVKMKKGKEDGILSNESQIAYIDREWLAASKGEQRVANEAQKRLAERQKERLENDYIGKVKQSSYEGLYTTGFISPDTSSQEAYNKDKEKIIQMLEKAREEILTVREYQGDKISILTLLGIDPEDKVFKPVLDANEADFDLFYKKLIQYSEEYTQAEKQEYEKRKKIDEFDWQIDPERIKMQTGINIAEARKADYDNMSKGSPTLNAVNGNDPEIALLSLKLDLAKAYYEFLNERNADDATLMEKQKAIADLTSALNKAVVEDVTARASAIQSLINPVAEFGNAVGDAFATMTTDAEEGQKAFQDAISAMIKSLMELTLKMSIEYANQAAMKKRLTRKGEKDATAETRKGESERTQIIDTEGVAQTALVSTVNAGILGIRRKTATETTAVQKQQAAEDVATTQNQTLADVVLGIAGGSAKIIGKLGWWGIPLVAVITALLNGLMSFATSKVAGLFGGGSNNNTNANVPNINTKLVSGMMTYDKGNLQQMYLGNDGKLYAAKNEDSLPTGIVTQPVATTINGQPSLVGERGPELVVGRETTAAMMQNAPGLLQALLDYDKNRRNSYQLYERGNVDDIYVPAEPAPDTQPAITQELLTQLLYYLQHPVAPNINMYGRDGLYEKSRKAERFMRGR